jgi:hypothetical protein
MKCLINLSNFASGGAGLVFGTAFGILRGISPGLSAAVTGIKWFTLASSYWRRSQSSSLRLSHISNKVAVSRTVIMTAWGGEGKLTKLDKTKASALAGGTAGMVGTLLSMTVSFLNLAASDSAHRVYQKPNLCRSCLLHHRWRWTGSIQYHRAKSQGQGGTRLVAIGMEPAEEAHR